MPRTFNSGLWSQILSRPSFSMPDFGAGGGGAGQGQGQGQGNGQQQGQQGQGQPQPNNGGQQGQQGTGGTGILNDPNAGDQGQPGQQPGQQQGQGQQTSMSQEQVQQLLAAQDQKWQSEIDRRINQIVQKGKVTPQGQGQPGDQGQGQGQQQPQGQQQVQAPTVDTASFDQREARLAYMQYVGDEIRFLNADERNLASNLAVSQIPGLIESGLTPNEAGLKAAKAVSTQVSALRTQYEQLVIAGLKRKGVLQESYGAGQGQATTQQGGVGPQSDWQKGAARAADMFGPPAGQQTTT